MSNVMLTRSAFNQRVHQLFQEGRKARFTPATLDWLATAPLVQRALALHTCAEMAPLSVATLARLCLAWLVELLRPPTDAPTDPKRLRDFTILAAYYGQGAAAKTVYQALDGTESTFRTNWCKAATTAAADLLYQHWDATAESASGRQWQLYVQIHALPPAVQPVLQLLAVSTTPWPVAWLAQLPRHLAAAPAAAQPSPLSLTLAKSTTTLQQLPIQEAVACLAHLGWVSAAVTTTTVPIVTVAPPLREQLCSSLTPAERQNGHRLAAHCAFLAQEALTAAWHWLQAGEMECAVQVLLESGQQLFTDDDLEGEQTPEETPLTVALTATLAPLLDQVGGQAVDAPRWGQLKRLRGRVAQLQARQAQATAPPARAALLQRALTEYQEAIHFLAAGIDKATVHYQLADLSFAMDGALADQHLSHCIEQLTSIAPDHALLVRAYIKRGWLTIQQRPDLTAAEANLKQARLLLDARPTRTPMLWSDWYNAWGTLCFCKGEFSQGVNALAQGIDLLREQPNQLRLCMMLHNQGLEFSTQHSGEQKIALHYLQQSLAIAIRSSYVQMQMLCYKALGGCYFHMAQYGTALTFYQQAYALIPADSDFKVHLCYDLAEAYVMRLEAEPALTYFRQGFQLAQQMALAELIAAYHALAAQSPWLWIEPYKPRMAIAIRLLLSHGQLKSQEYAQAANINEKTALKDLQEWVEQQILCQVGKARATVYRFREE